MNKTFVFTAQRPLRGRERRPSLVKGVICAGSEQEAELLLRAHWQCKDAVRFAIVELPPGTLEVISA